VKCAIVGYVPPPSFRGANAFIKNIMKFHPVNDLVLFSDHHDYGFTRIFNPEKVVGIEKNPRCGISNAVFITGLRLAVKKGYTHMLYLEADCRVGVKNWDEIMFEEYFSFTFPKVAAGSLVAHSCTNGGFEFYKRFTAFLHSHSKSKHVIPLYGIPVMAGVAMGEFSKDIPQVVLPGDARLRYKPSVYPNGALGIYDVNWLCELFGIKPDGDFKEGVDMVQHVQNSAWDHMIGAHLYDRFGDQVFDMVGHLDSVFSSYGDTVTTEAQRLQMLRDGDCTAIHQVKSEALP
jgi:hypothetical protein